MAETTGIHWTTATWNPWMGCHKVSQGCKNCYMYRDMPRYGKDPSVVVRSRTTFNDPLKWARSGRVKPGSMIFTCSLSDWFIPEADPWRDEAWHIVEQTPLFAYQVLTKRPERIQDHLPSTWRDGYDNVWLGVSAEDQENADKRVPILSAIQSKTRFLSCEPLLGPVDIEPYIRYGEFTPYGPRDIHWVITGGESGPNARPCNLDWVRSLRDQCKDAGVAFFHKQHGGNRKIDGAWGGRELDGRTWDEFPEVRS